jgi:hypothetical protein
MYFLYYVTVELTREKGSILSLLLVHLLEIDINEVPHILFRIRRLMLRHCFLKQVSCSPYEERNVYSVGALGRGVCSAIVLGEGT